MFLDVEFQVFPAVLRRLFISFFGVSCGFAVNWVASPGRHPENFRFAGFYLVQWGLSIQPTKGETRLAGDLRTAQI